MASKHNCGKSAHPKRDDAPIPAPDGDITLRTQKPYDVFLCGDDRHFDELRSLLPKVKSCGAVHLVSSFINKRNLAKLDGMYDKLHTPRLADDGYDNFKLFCLTVMNSVTESSWFIKMDADVKLSSDWINYIDETIATHPELVLFGPQSGRHNLNWILEGKTIRKLFGSDIHVCQEKKVVGGFYCANSNFFRKQDTKLKLLTELVYCFKNGVQLRPTKYLDGVIGGEKPEFQRKRGHSGYISEDNLRNLIVCIADAKHRVRVVPDSRVQVPPATSNERRTFESFSLQKVGKHILG